MTIRSIAHRLAGDAAALPVEGRLASFDGATSWLNTEPLTPEALRGRVVLVDFWTYTCVNWLRTLPYVRAWAAKYAKAGLTVVGVAHARSSASSGTSTTSSRSRATSASTTRSRSTATTASGAPSTTTSGRPCTSPTRRAGSATTTSARASTR